MLVLELVMLFDSFLSLSPASTTTPWRTLSSSSAQRLVPDCCVFVPTLFVYKFGFVRESVTDSFSPAARRLLPDCRGGLAYTCVPRRHGTYFYNECLADSGESNQVNVVHTFLEHALSHNHLSPTTRTTSGSLMTTTSEAPSLV